MHNLFKNAKIVPLRIDGTNYALTAGTDGAIINSDEIDTKGFDAVAFVTLLGAVSASGVMTQFVKNSDTSATYGSGTVDKLGSSLVNVSAGNGDNVPMIIDIHKPQRRYCRLDSQRTGGNVVVLACFAVLYNAHDLPVSQVTDAVSYFLNGPAPSST